MPTEDPDEPFVLDFAPRDARRFATSQEDLALALGGVSRRTIARLLKLPGNPGRTANGSYPLDAWRQFYEEYADAREREENAEMPPSVKAALAAKRLEREELRVERERIALEKERGALVAAEDVRAEWQAFYGRLTAQVRRFFVESAGGAEEYAAAEKKFRAFLEEVHAAERRRASADGATAPKQTT